MARETRHFYRPLLILSFVIELTSVLGQPAFRDCYLPTDILFLVDGSETVLPVDFKHQKEFISKQIDQYPISADRVRVGIILYSSTVKATIGLEPFKNAGELKMLVSKLVQPRDGTNFADAFRRVTRVFREEGRAGATKLAFVITDGWAKNHLAARMEAMVARYFGVKFIMIGVGELVRRREMGLYAAQADFVLSADAFLNISTLTDPIRRIVCPGVPNNTDFVSSTIFPPFTLIDSTTQPSSSKPAFSTPTFSAAVTSQTRPLAATTEQMTPPFPFAAATRSTLPPSPVVTTRESSTPSLPTTLTDIAPFPSPPPTSTDLPPLPPSPPTLTDLPPLPPSPPTLTDLPPLPPSPPTLTDLPPLPPSPSTVTDLPPLPPSPPTSTDLPPLPPSPPTLTDLPSPPPSPSTVTDLPPPPPSSTSSTIKTPILVNQTAAFPISSSTLVFTTRAQTTALQLTTSRESSLPLPSPTLSSPTSKAPVLTPQQVITSPPVTTTVATASKDCGLEAYPFDRTSFTLYFRGMSFVLSCPPSKIFSITYCTCIDNPDRPKDGALVTAPPGVTRSVFSSSTAHSSTVASTPFVSSPVPTSSFDRTSAPVVRPSTTQIVMASSAPAEARTTTTTPAPTTTVPSTIPPTLPPTTTTTPPPTTTTRPPTTTTPPPTTTTTPPPTTTTPPPPTTTTRPPTTTVPPPPPPTTTVPPPPPPTTTTRAPPRPTTSMRTVALTSTATQEEYLSTTTPNNDPTTDATTAITTTSEEVVGCLLSPYLPDNRYYKEQVQGFSDIVRPCPIGTIFKARICACGAAEKSDFLVGRKACKPEIFMNFDYGLRDSSDKNVATGSENVVIVNGTAKFTGRSRIRIWRFQDAELGSTMTIRLKFKTMGKRFSEQPILGNCGKDLQQSFSITLDRMEQKLVYSVMSYADNAQVETGYLLNEWNDISLVYDGNKVSGITNGLTRFSFLNGNIQRRPNSVSVGFCEGAGGFTGYMDDIRIYMCIPPDIQVGF